jgi:hypothetical protein
MKLKAIETNAYSKYFEARVGQLSKEVSNILQFFKTWKNITKNWAYLIPVFTQEDIMRVMPDKVKNFDEINERYNKIMNDAHRTGDMTY